MTSLVSTSVTSCWCHYLIAIWVTPEPKFMLNKSWLDNMCTPHFFIDRYLQAWKIIEKKRKNYGTFKILIRTWHFVLEDSTDAQIAMKRRHSESKLWKLESVKLNLKNWNKKLGQKYENKTCKAKTWTRFLKSKSRSKLWIKLRNLETPPMCEWHSG